MFMKIIIVALFLTSVGFIINIAPNYVDSDIKDKINLIINNGNVTKSLKFDMFLDEKETVYISTKDIANFFDEDIFYDNKYNLIITSSNTKIATLEIGKQEMEVNGARQSINSPAIKKDNEFYLPFSEMSSIYNVETKYIKDTNRVIIDSLDRQQKKGNSSKNTNVKALPTVLSRNVDKINKGENIVVISSSKNGWIKVRTNRGKIGYVKDVSNIYNVRQDLEINKQVEGNISLAWEYFSEYGSAPNRTGTTLKGVNVVSPYFATLKSLGEGDININIGQSGKNYIDWAHSNGYKVWAIVSNESHKETTSMVVNDYKLRSKLINNIVNMAIENNLDGINLDFEYMNMSDKDMFSRLIIELAPRLREYGMVLSVDVTAPDGGENWSMCYNRNKIGKYADYVVFMAYDQHGDGTDEGTVAGADWIETNLKKFVGTQEEIPSEKIILGMPFYTRIWYKNSKGEQDSDIIQMKNIDNIIPATANRVWDDNTKQYYAEYEKNGKTYKCWIEDEKSIKEKCNLVLEYKLAGAGYWKKDGEKPEVWDVISEKLNVK